MILIEKVRPKDARELLAIYAPYVENTAISFEYTPPTPEEFAERIEKISAHYPYLKAVENGKICGFAYASRLRERKAYDWVAELSVYVRPDCQGKGVGRKLYEELFSQLKKQGVLRVFASCTADETSKSPAFHQAMGFERVGVFKKAGIKFNREYDLIWYERDLEKEV